MKDDNYINKIKSDIKNKRSNTTLNHFKTVLRIVFLWDFDSMFGEIDGLKFTIWKTDLFASVFYPIISGEFVQDREVKISLKINPLGKIIYFLFCTLIISFLSIVLIKDSTNINHYLLSGIIILIISIFVFYLGYLGNRVFKSRATRHFNEYLKCL